MKKENEIKARLKDIIATLNEVDEGSLDYYCLLQKKELLEWILNTDNKKGVKNTKTYEEIHEENVKKWSK